MKYFCHHFPHRPVDQSSRSFQVFSLKIRVLLQSLIFGHFRDFCNVMNVVNVQLSLWHMTVTVADDSNHID